MTFSLVLLIIFLLGYGAKVRTHYIETKRLRATIKKGDRCLIEDKGREIIAFVSKIGLNITLYDDNKIYVRTIKQIRAPRL